MKSRTRLHPAGDVDPPCVPRLLPVSQSGRLGVPMGGLSWCRSVCVQVTPVLTVTSRSTGAVMVTPGDAEEKPESASSR